MDRPINKQQLKSLNWLYNDLLSDWFVVSINKAGLINNNKMSMLDEEES